MITAQDLYEQNKIRVYRYCYGVLYNREDAEDITSKTFLTALQKLDQTKKYAKHSTWLISIARNHIGNMWQKKKMSLLHDFTTLEIENSAKILGHEEQDKPIKSAITAEISSDINEALAKISACKREIIILKIWEELTYREIGKLLNLKSESVRIYYYQARQELKKLLKQTKDKRMWGITLFAINQIKDNEAGTIPPHLDKLLKKSIMEDVTKTVSEETVKSFLGLSTKILIGVGVTTLVILAIGVGYVSLMKEKPVVEPSNDNDIETVITPTTITSNETDISNKADNLINTNVVTETPTPTNKTVKPISKKPTKESKYKGGYFYGDTSNLYFKGKDNSVKKITSLSVKKDNVVQNVKVLSPNVVGFVINKFGSDSKIYIHNLVTNKTTLLAQENIFINGTLVWLGEDSYIFEDGKSVFEGTVSLVKVKAGNKTVLLSQTGTFLAGDSRNTGTLVCNAKQTYCVYHIGILVLSQTEESLKVISLSDSSILKIPNTKGRSGVITQYIRWINNDTFIYNISTYNVSTKNIDMKGYSFNVVSQKVEALKINGAVYSLNGQYYLQETEWKLGQKPPYVEIFRTNDNVKIKSLPYVNVSSWGIAGSFEFMKPWLEGNVLHYIKTKNCDSSCGMNYFKVKGSESYLLDVNTLQDLPVTFPVETFSIDSYRF